MYVATFQQAPRRPRNSHVDPVTATRYPRPTLFRDNCRMQLFLRDGFTWRCGRGIRTLNAEGSTHTLSGFTCTCMYPNTYEIP